MAWRAWLVLVVALAMAPCAHAQATLPLPSFPFPGEIPLRTVAPLSQSDDALLAKADALLDADRIDEAQRLAEQELAKAKAAHGPNHPLVASWLLRLGRVQGERGDHAAAEQLLKQCLAIREKTLGPNSPEVGEVLLYLAMTSFRQRRYAEASRHLERVLAIYVAGAGDDDPSVADVREMLAITYAFQERYEEAAAVYTRALANHERTYGPESERAVVALVSIAMIYIQAEQFDEAEVMAKRALGVRQKRFGPSHVKTAEPMGLLSTAYIGQGRYPEAEPLLAGALAIFEKAVGPEAEGNLAHYLGWRTVLDRELARYAQAEAAGKRALALWQRVAGPEHERTGIAVGDLALVYWQMGRFTEAEAMLRRALSIIEKAGKPRLLANAVNNLANLLVELGRYADAEAQYLRAIALHESRQTSIHPDVGTVLHNLAQLYEKQGRYSEAESLFARALSIDEKVRPDHPGTATLLVNYSVFLDRMGRAAEAEAFRTRALVILEKRLGAGHPAVAITLQHVAGALTAQRRYAEAEALERRAVAILEAALGPDHPNLAAALTGLADDLAHLRRFAEAEKALTRALNIAEKAVGPEHYDVAAILDQTAELKWRQDRASEAEPLARRAIAIFQKVVSPAHPALRDSYVGLSLMLLDRGRPADAVAAARAAVAVQRARGAEAQASRAKGRYHEELGGAAAHAQLIRALFALSQARRGDTALTAEAYEAAQLAEIDETSEAMARMASRFAAGAGALAALLREQQRLLSRIPVLDELTANVSASSDPAARAQAAAFRSELAAIEARLKEIDATLRRDHRAYADLVDPKALSLAETQSLLADDEAVVMHIVAREGTYVFAVAKRSSAWARAALGEAELARHVAALRRELDPDQWQASMMPFDRALAHRLYRELWQPVETVLAESQVFTVPTGVLTSFPLSVLVTAPPQGGDSDPNALRETAWLAKRHALVTLPSVASLKALRLYANKGAGSEPFAGFGDPALGGAGSARGRRSVSSVFRGPSPDLGALRALAPLPAAAGELKALAAALGAAPDDVYLRERATETQLKSLDLSRKRVIAFATHALTAGDLGFGEPGLVFTPPATAGARDDGYLAASEAAALDLRADWIILSACNTAAGDKPGAKGLSGLARAFFLAGARSLLVSHWSVWDDAAGRITTATLKSHQSNPRAGRAAALRQAMLAVMQDGASPRFAHPAAWAPFVLVGEPN